MRESLVTRIRARVYQLPGGRDESSGFDYLEFAQRMPIVVDTRNALSGVYRDKLFRL